MKFGHKRIRIQYLLERLHGKRIQVWNILFDNLSAKRRGNDLRCCTTIFLENREFDDAKKENKRNIPGIL